MDNIRLNDWSWYYPFYLLHCKEQGRDSLPLDEWRSRTEPGRDRRSRSDLLIDQWLVNEQREKGAGLVGRREPRAAGGK
jgi:hypothetical protein